MSTLKQLNAQLLKKKEKASKLTADVKILKEEIKAIKEQIGALKGADIKPVKDSKVKKVVKKAKKK